MYLTCLKVEMLHSVFEKRNGSSNYEYVEKVNFELYVGSIYVKANIYFSVNFYCKYAWLNWRFKMLHIFLSLLNELRNKLESRGLVIKGESWACGSWR